MLGTYQERVDRFSAQLSAEEARGLRLGWIRLCVFLAGFAAYVGSDLMEGSAARLSGVAALACAAAFLILVVVHRRVRTRQRWFRTLAEINRSSVARVRRDWGRMAQDLRKPPPSSHPYALDLDLCGEASLFRLLNTVTLSPGAETLRRWLLGPAAPDLVRRRQEAVSDLAPRLEFRQRLEGEGRMMEEPDAATVSRFLAWAESEPWLPQHTWALWAARALPLVTLVLFVLFWNGILQTPWWLASLGLTLGFGSYLARSIHPIMARATAGQEQFARFAALLSLLLEENLEAKALLTLKEKVRSSPVGAAHELRRFGRLAGWADVRLSSMAHAPLQAIFLWDVHVLAGLEGWKARSGTHVREWLEVLGELEALCAFATLKYDHPDWCTPELEADGSPGLDAKELGHPLLPPEDCVRNDLSLGPPGSFLFLTGSNMSGKSTLLRAVGLNAVLAQAGAPACATWIRLSPLRVQTSMRTADSLAEGVSQYMAELKRIRQVVDEARRGGALYLLDEPLQGTNEAERRVAVQTVLGHLLEAGAIGGVATHDLQLHATPGLSSAARAVHLEGAVQGGEEGPVLTFDYRLKPGPATSTNALALLRAVGLGPGRTAESEGPEGPKGR